MLKARLFALLAALPTISVNLDDYHLSVCVGERRPIGVTVGPRFLSIDMDGDIAHMVVSPPESYQPPISDISLTWDSRRGLSHFNVPAVNVNRSPSAHMWDKSFPSADNGGIDALDAEECEPSTVREYRRAVG